jgi:hypothetical protein
MADRLVTIRTFSLPWEADICRLFLEQEDIRAYVNEDRSAMVNYFWSIALGGIKVQIAESDSERAETVLAEVKIESDASRSLLKKFIALMFGIYVIFWLLSVLIIR